MLANCFTNNLIRLRFLFDIPFCVGYNTENASCKEGAEFFCEGYKDRGNQKDILIYTDISENITVRESVATVEPNSQSGVSEVEAVTLNRRVLGSETQCQK